MGGDLDVVEPHHREILRNPQAHLPGRLHHPEGHQVVPRHDGGGSPPQFEQFLSRPLGHLRLEGPGPDETWVHGKVSGPQGLPISSEPVGRCRGLPKAGDEPDPPVPQPEEVVRQVAAGPHIVQDDVVAAPGAQTAVVHETGIAGINEGLHHRVTKEHGAENDSVHPPLAENLDVLFLQS